MKHTKGPWFVERDCIWSEHHSACIAEVYVGAASIFPTVEEKHANAQLIAMAPELFHTLMIIAERAEELTADVTNKTADAEEIFRAMAATGKKARAVLDRARKGEET